MKRPTISGQRARAHEQLAAIRSRLCAAAEELFVEEGESELSMRRLTAKVGCSAMAPYRYFADKEALIASIRAQAFRRLADTLDEVSSAGRDEAADVGEAYVRFARANPGAYTPMFELHQPDERASPEARKTAGYGKGG